MKAENLLLLGGVGVALYLIYQTASSAADVIPNVAKMAQSAAQSVTGAVQAAIAPVQAGVQTIEAAPSMWNCADSWATSQVPFGVGALMVPDSYLIPCSGGVTAGALRAGGASNSEVIQYIAALECSCAAAKLPGSGVTVKDNVIVPLAGYRLPAGVVRA